MVSHIHLTILIIHAVLPVLSQILSSSQPTGQQACPGEEITFTCVTVGSPSIGWTSDEYIEQGGNPLEFALFDNVGNTQRSPVNPETVATLINKNTDDQVLESQLRIIILSNSPTFSVSCVHGNGSERTIGFQVLGVSNMPQGIMTTQRKDNCSGRCTILLGWSPPVNIAPEDVSHYMVYINGSVNVLSDRCETDKNFTLTAYPVSRCGAYLVSVSAVNRCGHESQRSPLIMLDQEPLPLPLTMCEDTPASTQREKSDYQVATIALSIVICVVLILLISGLFICFLITWNKRNTKVATTGEMAAQ